MDILFSNKWFVSRLDKILSNREQMVQIRSTKSTRLIIYGFLQDTVLGPILFIMYINQLIELDCQSALISYCDDTVLLIEAESWEC